MKKNETAQGYLSNMNSNASVFKLGSAVDKLK